MAGNGRAKIMHYVYFAKSIKTGKVYIGSTRKDPVERVKEHNVGANNWSRINKPLKLIYYEKYHCGTDALSREKFYKSGFGRRVKELIIRNLEK